MEILGNAGIFQKIASIGVKTSMVTNSFFINPAENCSDVISRQTSYISQRNPIKLQQTSDLYRKRPEFVLEGMEIAAGVGDVDTAANLIVLYHQGENNWSITLRNRALDSSAPLEQRGEAAAFFIQAVACTR